MSRGLDTFTGEFVYRTLRPDEDPTKDIACMNSGSRRGVDEHVEDGLTYSSRFISTSASFSKAEKWIHTARRHSPARYSERGVRNTIVKISVKILKDEYPNTANSAYNFTDRLVRAKFLPESDQRGFARGYEEVVFISSIPKEAITDVYVVGRGWIGTSPPIEQITNTPPLSLLIAREQLQQLTALLTAHSLLALILLSSHCLQCLCSQLLFNL